MKLINFIIWLSAGAVIGWFASRMVQLEHRPTPKQMMVKVSSLDES